MGQKAIVFWYQTKKEGKDQESIQSSTTRLKISLSLKAVFLIILLHRFDLIGREKS